MGIPLAVFNKKLEAYVKAPLPPVEQEIRKIVMSVLMKMADLTIEDTNTAKSLLLEKYAETIEEMGSTSSMYGTPYEYWHSIHQRSPSINKDSATLYDICFNTLYTMVLSIDDRGLYNQEIGKSGYPSSEVTDKAGKPRDNSRYMPRHLTYVADTVNHGTGLNVELYGQMIADKIMLELGLIR